MTFDYILLSTISTMNQTNTSSTLRTPPSVNDGLAPSIFLSVVMPVVLVVFCISYMAWSMERDTRPEKKETNKNKLSVQPLKLEEVPTKIEVKSKV